VEGDNMELKNYSVTVYGDYAFDVILVKANDKTHALSKFKSFVIGGNATNLLKRYQSIMDSIKCDGVDFVNQFTEDDFDEINEDFMLLAQFIE
jgi:hypothetical protein